MIVLPLTERLKDKFFIKFKNEGDGCWEWLAGKDKNGYGRFDNFLAHRLSWILHVGDIPKGIYVCHTCDNPSCVNPNHLFLGTASDNALDKAKKDRVKYGENHPLSVLKEEDVLKIFKSNGSFTEIGKLFKVSKSCVQAIKNGTRWTRTTNKFQSQENP